MTNSHLDKISHYCSIEIVTIKEDNFLKDPNIEDQNIIIQNECDLITKYFPNPYDFSLCSEGKQIDSIGFSNQIKKLEDVGNYEYSKFIIGSSHA